MISLLVWDMFFYLRVHSIRITYLATACRSVDEARDRFPHPAKSEKRNLIRGEKCDTTYINNIISLLVWDMSFYLRVHTPFSIRITLVLMKFEETQRIRYTISDTKDDESWMMKYCFLCRNIVILIEISQLMENFNGKKFLYQNFVFKHISDTDFTYI
jgi:hypothetical protein